jgi:hypothetical protein
MSGDPQERPRDDAARRPLTAEEAARIAAARRKAHILYEGKQVQHWSCGIALAATFNVPTRPYQSLRRGGITGEGECGAIKAGELILGEYLGDPDPTGKVTPALRAAAAFYRDAWLRRIDRGPGGAGGSIVCNLLTAPWGDFAGAARLGFCTGITAAVAELVAETLVRFGASFVVTPIPGVDDPLIQAALDAGGAGCAP